MSDMKRIVLPISSSSVIAADGLPSTKRLLGPNAVMPQSTSLQSNPLLASGVPLSSVVSGDSTQTGKTFRIDLELFEPTANWFPEFDYNKLVHVEKKKVKKLTKVKVNGISDPFEEDDESDIARIAKDFEAKYGNGGRSKSGKRSDYYDKGAGYDESDSFIDNTEAYDEIIPEEVETVEGGFYINSGALEFTHLSNYEKTEQPATKSKKRILSTSSSSGDEEKNGGDKNNTIEVEDKAQENNSKQNGLKPKVSDKKLKLDDESYKNANSKPKQIEKPDIEIEPAVEKTSDTLPIEPCDENTKRGDQSQNIEKETAASNVHKIVQKEKPVKTTTIKDMLKAKRDNFRKMREGESKSRVANGESVKSSEVSESSNESSGAESGTESDAEGKKLKKEQESNESTELSLPPGLSEDILKDIREAKSMFDPEKGFQLDDRLIESLLRIDDSCSHLEKVYRDQVYAHLEHKWSLPKHYLYRKIKSLRIKLEKSKTKKALMKLKKSVGELMPSVELTYEMNCKKIDEERRLADPQSDDAQIKYPKKKFPWNDTLRNSLYEVFQVRWASYAVLKTKRESFEDFVSSFMKQKVMPIWPTGWMKYEDLQKELEKRKINVKKPKENKKPGEHLAPTKRKPNDDFDASLQKKPLLGVDTTKSVLSNSNSVSIVSTKDLVVTISTTRADKKADSSNVTSVVQPTQPKPHKMNSSKPNSNSNTITSATIQNRIVNKPFTEPTIRNVPQVNSDQGHNVEINTNAPIDEANTCSSMLSPTKRATDHSINSIMSSNALNPTTTQHHSKSDTMITSSTSINNIGKTNNLESAKTHVINVDKLKSTSEIINTTNQILNNILGSETNNVSVSTSNVGSKEGLIRIRSFANANNLEKEKPRKKESSKIKQSTILSDRGSGSESDDCKIVDEYPIKKSTKISTKVGNVRRETSSNGSRSISPNINMALAYDDARRAGTHLLKPEAKETELDFTQVMRALRELQEMQQSAIDQQLAERATQSDLTNLSEAKLQPIKKFSKP